ncbi:MAG: transcriptional regulator with XRE-family HTH domain [Oleiphilaceae bacterium]|jgi:transcriptional regulator with XRE-family HTH domain
MPTMEKRLNIENAKAALEDKGFSQADLARQLKVSKEAVSQWFKGNSYPRPNKLLQLGKLLELSFSKLVSIDEPNAPIVAFRKESRTRIKDHHIEEAQEVGRFLNHLAPYSPFDTLEVPPTLKSPCCDYEYLQQASQKVRSDINIAPDARIDFTHLIRRFEELQAVIVPVLWGVRKHHANAMHIYLPESRSTWIYLNLDVNVHDFKFWMAHELGHCLSPLLTGSDEGEDFADAFASALLFPKVKAEKAYNEITVKRTVKEQIDCLLDIADDEVISPYTILLEVNKYAKYIGQSKIDLGKNYYGRIIKFNNKHQNISEVLFDDLKNVSIRDFISKVSEAFDTPFFDILSKYLQESKKGAGFVQAVTNMSLLDTRGMHAELT